MLFFDEIMLVVDVVLTSMLILAISTAQTRSKLEKMFIVGLLSIFVYFHLLAIVYISTPIATPTQAYLLGTFRPVAFLMGPLIYFYIKALTHPRLTLRWRDAVHLIPCLICLWEVVPLYFLPAAEKLQLLSGSSFQITLKVRFAFFLALSLVYIVFSYKMLDEFEKKIQQHYAETKQWMLGWIRICLFVTAIVWCICLLYSLDGIDYHEINIITFAFFATTYILTFVAIRRSFIFNLGSEELYLVSLPSYKVLENAQKPSSGLPKGLTEQDLEKGMARLKDQLECHHIYRNSHLKLRDLASAVDMPEYVTSQILNAGFKKNFYEVINHYRIEEAKALLSPGLSSDKQIIEVAYEVGYNTKSAFNAAFKKIVGQTPTEFRQDKATV